MELTRRTLIGAATAATATSAALAGCLGGGEGDGEETTTAADTETEAEEPAADEETTADDGGDATVQVRTHEEHGDVLVGPDGLSLYNFDRDTQGGGASTCYDGCAENWPPLTVDDEPTAGDAVATDLSAFEREDGATQVAAAGWPLYYFAADEEPGDANGQGANDVWWLLRPDGTRVRPDDSGSGGDSDDGSDDGGYGDGGYGDGN